MLARSLELLQAERRQGGQQQQDEASGQGRMQGSNAPAPPAHLPPPRNDPPTRSHVYSAGRAHVLQANGASVLDVLFAGLALSSGSGIPVQPSVSESTPPKQREDRGKQKASQGEMAVGGRAAPSAYLSPELFLSLLQLLSQMTLIVPGTSRVGLE
jgi:hypothetical protein